MKYPCFPIFAAVVFATGLLPVVGQNARPKDDPAFLKKSALQIDQYVAAFYRRQKLEVPGVTDDATFLRRAFLVSVGRIPSSEEAIGFLEMDDATKREELVAYLLESPGHASHMSNWAFDLLRLTDRRVDTMANNEPYRNWVREAIENNMPWDKMVNRMLSSQGDGWDPSTAGVGYYTRDRGMPLDNLANTMRVFLGARMECAQCHDDPFGKTERHDFYQLAAFTHGQDEVRASLIQSFRADLAKKVENYSTPEFLLAQFLDDQVYGASLAGGGAGNIPLPMDYQYRDAKPGEVVGAKTPFGKPVRMSEKKEDGEGRKAFADWIINKTGEQFPTVIANRMWRQVMGKGIYEPVDEYLPPEKTHYPELITYISRLMVELDYDLRAFQHVLMLTRTFQFGTNPQESIIASADDFHGRKIQRLSSEQIWDSLITLAGGNPDGLPRRTLDDRIVIGGKPVLPNRRMGQLSKEVLALETEEEFRVYFDKLLAEMKQGGSAPSGDSMMSMGMTQVRTYNRDAKVRASELPSPAPREHFLYLFGQSDRMVVEGASRDPNVGQVLSLMNGFVQRQLVNNSQAHIYKTLDGASNDPEKIRRLYITILSRPPSDEEMQWMLAEVKAQGESGYRNIVSALVMSSEFLFLQ
jgi:hypothetical protein